MDHVVTNPDSITVPCGNQHLGISNHSFGKIHSGKFKQKLEMQSVEKLCQFSAI